MALVLSACAGTAGLDGKDGTNGANGNNGANGATGPTGTQGSGGATGATGATGSNGQNGYGLSTGLTFKVNSVAVANDGTVTVDYNLIDDQQQALDKDGKYSLGVIAPRFGLARLDSPTSQFSTLTRSTSGGATLLNTANAGTGTVTEVATRSGHYTYTFPAKYPDMAGAEASKTYTLFVQAARQTDPLDANTKWVANVTYDFVPAGGTPINREIVKTANCNGCHNPLAIHGGNRRDAKLCAACHNSELGVYDLSHYVHAIHSAKDLGSAGNYSEVTYPLPTRDCGACHRNAALFDMAKVNANVSACTGCHSWLKFRDETVTATCRASDWQPGTDCNHLGNVATTADCVFCHSDGSVAPVSKAHATPDVYWNLINTPPTLQSDAAKNPVVTTKIDAVSIDANRMPTFTFTIKTSYAGQPAQPRDLVLNPLQTFRVAYAMSKAGAGAVEYVRNGRFDIPGWPVKGVAITSVPQPTGTPGQYTWTAPTALPALDPDGAAYTGTDTVAFAIETAEGDEFLPYEIEIKGVTSDVFFWRLDNQNSGSNKPLTRRVLVSQQKCLACHGEEFGFHHAGSRNNVQECAFCHDARTVNARATRILPTTGTEDRTALSIQASVMIHRIHTGTESQDPTWTYYANSGQPLERATYPGNRIDCAQCHVTPSNPASSVWGLPLNAAVSPTTKSIAYECSPTGCDEGTPILTARNAAVCGSCHDSAQAQAHIAQNTPNGVETCDLCHGLSKGADVRKVHVRAP